MNQASDIAQDTRAASASRPRAIVHLGLNKTGTTAIQQWLALNEAALADQGFYYDGFTDNRRTPCQQTGILPTITYTPAGLLLPSQPLRQKLGVTTLKEQVAVCQQIEKAFADSLAHAGDKTVILSSELLGSWTRKPEVVAAICDKFEEMFSHITYVLYVREQAEWLASAYVQAVKTAAVVTIDEFAEMRGRNDYDHLASLWCDRAGRENVVFRLYDRDFLVGGDAISDFAHVCGIKLDSVKTPGRANESLTDREVRVLLFLNRTYRKLGINPFRQIRRTRRLARLFRGGRKSRIPAQVATRVREWNHASNERFRQRFFPERPILFSAFGKDAPTQTISGATSAPVQQR